MTTDNDDPSMFTQGYADACGWLPKATPDELVELAAAEHRKHSAVLIYPDHTLADHWGHSGPVGLGTPPVGDVDRWDDNGYGEGFYTALRDHRPDIFERVTR
ncbi:hypothetical protein [Mycobacterium sp. E2238]|uniref:hypothetical protein n=1 Tax=Mycobacterium sp. E2238 TaxID=1834131 RepID=UPI0007FBC5C8|nr:hypothetical protein [Mycobacterium sp. E2238]OBI31094.1 hypothetical protein A5711_21605 [Mycobacterium sp. E2238]